jgi:hypothetical protein
VAKQWKTVLTHIDCAALKNWGLKNPKVGKLPTSTKTSN